MHVTWLWQFYHICCCVLTACHSQEGYSRGWSPWQRLPSHLVLLILLLAVEFSVLFFIFCEVFNIHYFFLYCVTYNSAYLWSIIIKKKAKWWIYFLSLLIVINGKRCARSNVTGWLHWPTFFPAWQRATWKTVSVGACAKPSPNKLWCSIKQNRVW